MTRRTLRIDSFKGTDSEYIKYLEYQLMQFRSDAHPSTEPQLRGPVNSGLRQHGTIPGQMMLNDKHMQSSPLPELDIVIWSPGRPSNNANSATAVAFPDRFNSFRRGIPRNEEEWEEKRQSLDLANPDGLFRAFDELMLVSPTWTMEKDLPVNGVQDSLIQYGNRLGIITHEVHRLKKISKFGKLIFIAACCVAINTKHPRDKVDDAMRSCLTSMATAKTLRRYRRTALFILQQMDELYPELSHRAFEIFLHG